MLAELDALLTAFYVVIDDFLPARSGPGRRPRITDAELITLAIAQIFLDCPSERRFLRFARQRLGHLFAYIPGQPAYNRRLRRLAPMICQVIAQLARSSPSFGDRLRLLDSTPVPCGASRETVKRSALAGYAAYGYCASHSRYFWGLRLYLVCAPDGMPIAFCLAPANEPEREVAAALLERAARGELLHGHEIYITDKGFAGAEFEQFIHDALGSQLMRPDRRDEPPRFGALGGVRQWIESINDTLKGQFSLERHGAHTPEGVWARVCQRVLALAAGCWHNWLIGQPMLHRLRPLNPTDKRHHSSSPVARRRPAPIGEAIATIVAILTRGLHAQLVLDPIGAYGAKGFDMQRTSTIRLRASLLEEANEIVARDYASDLLLDDIARRVASSRRQLQRAYAEIGHTTFRAHLTRVRMDRAAELLSTRMFTVREVAHRVGYRQPAQFAKAFRRYRGIAPSDYRSGGNSASAPLHARAA